MRREKVDLGRRFMVAYLQGVRDFNDAFVKKQPQKRREVIAALAKHTPVKDLPLYCIADELFQSAAEPFYLFPGDGEEAGHLRTHPLGVDPADQLGRRDDVGEDDGNKLSLFRCRRRQL